MVSLWPFKGDPNSTTSFEKTLNALSAKIQKATAKNDSLRKSARRARVGVLLYATIAYTLIFVVLTFVSGYRNWGPYEIAVIAGGPVLIYGVREALVRYYNWRISSSQAVLDGLYKERDGTIERLKAATKYDSTQQLLDKYAQPSPKQKEANRVAQSPTSKKGGGQEARVFRQPPPTANIARNRPKGVNEPSTSSHAGSPRTPGNPTESPNISLSERGAVPPEPQAGAEFAPNAFTEDHLRSVAPTAGFVTSRWYDRIVDALLGEDETQARNRIALICRHCRLVNGQAPPGTKTLAEIGRWRCSACHRWNGEESETSQLLQKVAPALDEARADHDATRAVSAQPDIDSSVEAGSEDGAIDVPVETAASGEGEAGSEEEVEVAATPARTLRARRPRKGIS